MRTGTPSAMPRAPASAGLIQCTGSGSALASVGSAGRGRSQNRVLWWDSAGTTADVQRCPEDEDDQNHKSS
jgi:hypothetical protein